MYTKKNVTVLVTVVVLVFTGVFLFWGTVHARVYQTLLSLKLIPITETFTELYFEDHALLPKNTVVNEKMAFSFTIHNMEGATTTYPYTAYFLYPSGYRVVFRKSTVTLATGAFQNIPVTHTWGASNLQGKVVVELDGFNQHIAFLLPNHN